MKAGLFKTLCYSLGISLLASPITVPACTGIQLKAKDGAVLMKYADTDKVLIFPMDEPMEIVQN